MGLDTSLALHCDGGEDNTTCVEGAPDVGSQPRSAIIYIREPARAVLSAPSSPL